MRLRALGVIGAQVDVDERPAVLVADLAAETIDVVIVAADRDRPRAVDSGADDLPLLDVIGNEDEAAQAGARRMRRDAVGEVAGRRTRNGVET
jgi:hypothetical protein